VFFLTSIGLTVLGTMENRSSILDGVIDDGPANSTPQAPAPILPNLPSSGLPSPE
jgi:hypothetical protein